MDLQKFIENNLDRIITVQDIHNLADFNLYTFPMESYNFDELLHNENELYREMITLKKSGQLTLNLFKSFNEYKSCITSNFEERNYLLLEHPYDKYNEQSRENMKLLLIEIICKYVKLRQAILTKESKTTQKSKVGKLTDENLDSLMSSVCFYCDSPFYSNMCDMCGADTNDMQDYARYHTKSLRIKKNSRSNIGNTFSKLLEPVIEHIPDNSNQTISTWKCNKCSFNNPQDGRNCEVCLELQMDCHSVSEGNSQSDTKSDGSGQIPVKKIKLVSGKPEQIQSDDILRKTSSGECGHAMETPSEMTCIQHSWRCWLPDCTHCAICRNEDTTHYDSRINNLHGKMRNTTEQCKDEFSQKSDYTITSV